MAISDEVRGRCATVMSAVDSKLPAPERAVVRARFTPAEYEQVGAGGLRRRRYFYGPGRVESIRYLSDWLAPSSSITGPALDMLVAKAFANHERLAVSFRDMAQSFGSNHITYAFPKIRERLRELEAVAVSRLDGCFAALGLIATDEVAP